MRIARNTHHKDTHLCLKQTPISHLNAPQQGMTRLFCVRVCVFPGGPPEGILDRAEHVVSRVVFLLFLFSGSNFLRRKQIFYRENICRKNLLAYD